MEKENKKLKSREIKFRARDKKRKIMVGSNYPDNWEMEKDEYWQDWVMLELTLIESISHKDNFVLMQYTGIKDKNGVEIYEGDIVKRKQKEGGVLEADKNEYICYIEWFMNGWSCRESKDHCGFTFGGEHMEVIGNIFENPELLEATHDTTS